VRRGIVPLSGCFCVDGDGSFLAMKFIFKAVLRNIAVLFVICSCATVTEGPRGPEFSLGKKEPSGREEFRLLSVNVPQMGNLSENIEYWTTIDFEASHRPEISRACFNFPGGSQSCVNVKAKDVTYGSHAYFRVPIHVPVGTRRIDCYAEYVRDGEVHRTNTVTYYVVTLKKPEE